MQASVAPCCVTFGGAGEKARRVQLADLIRHSPIPDEELPSNLGVYLTPQNLSRILFMDFLYRKVLDIQGVVMEFGCRWGQNTALFSALRGIYEPFNRLRRVIGFDTFAGFPSTTPQDGGQVSAGMYAVTAGYQSHLSDLMVSQEQESPLSHLTKHELVAGDVMQTVPAYLERHPETVVALAYFDLDLYEPTLECLRRIRDRLTVGSVLGFDEANDPLNPGETLALKEVLGLDRYALRRFPYSARTSYLAVER
jgi:hypothetical protein